MLHSGTLPVSRDTASHTAGIMCVANETDRISSRTLLGAGDPNLARGVAPVIKPEPGTEAAVSSLTKRSATGSASQQKSAITDSPQNALGVLLDSLLELAAGINAIYILKKSLPDMQRHHY